MIETDQTQKMIENNTEAIRLCSFLSCAPAKSKKSFILNGRRCRVILPDGKAVLKQGIPCSIIV